MESRVDDYVRLPIQLTDQVRRAADEADSFRQECTELSPKVELLRGYLLQVARQSASSVYYEHPTRRIMDEARKTLEKTLALVKKCKKSGILKRVITITSATDFRKVTISLDSTIQDVSWLLAVSGGGSDTVGLPPIVATDPNLAFVWQQIAMLHAGDAKAKADGAGVLASLAKSSERNGKIIIEEGGLVPLIKLLGEGSPAGQEAAATALQELATDQQRAMEIVRCGAIPHFVHVLADAPIKVQTIAAYALAAIVSQDKEAQLAFGSAGVIRHLVALINDTIEDASRKSNGGSNNIHSVARMAQTKAAASMLYGDGPHKLPVSHGENGKPVREHSKRAEREHEDPEAVRELRAAVVMALWKLAAECVKNCRHITDTRALLCLAKLIEKGEGQVRRNAVMAVAAIAAVAETDQELRKAAFKMVSQSVRAVVEQLLRVIDAGDAEVQVPAVRAIGCLSRMFPAKETEHIVKPLAEQLGRDHTVASEAALALQKFTHADNYLKVEHSKAILEANGASMLVTLAYFEGEAQQNAVILLCNLAQNVGDHRALKDAGVLKALDAASKQPQVIQSPAIRELLPKAIEHLELYQAGTAAAARGYPDS